MKKKYLSLILILLIPVFLTACTKGPGKSSSGTTGQNNTPSSTNKDSGPASISGTINDLIKLGKNYKCTYSLDDQGMKMDGTTYTAGGKARTDYTMEINVPEQDYHETMETHMVLDGDMAYMWGDSMDSGMKYNYKKLQDMNKDTEQDPTTQQQVKEFQKKIDYKCTPWVVNNSVFQIPTDITFEDYTDTYTNMNNDLQDIKDNTCDLCRKLPTQDAIDECLSNSDCE